MQDLIADYDFELPEELIAQSPARIRDQSRLLVVDRSTGVFTDSIFSEIGNWLNQGDLLVVNDTRVFPARLAGRRAPSGGRVELFLVAERGEGVWEALARPAVRLRRGTIVHAGEGGDTIEIEIVDELPGGRRTIRFPGERSIWEKLERVGRTPLPPYIRRDAERAGEILDPDRERYQTVYARHRGAIAAPTAGLHFTPELLSRLEERGIERESVTLHVGYGTFQPVRVQRVEDHTVDAERFVVSASAAEAFARARTRCGRVVAVGTTTTRALETAVGDDGTLRVGAGATGIFLRPGSAFRAVDALVTNFHLPKSSLLLLVSAFAGRELVLEAYRHAVRERYRFYSYGDAMLVL
ncbi:MAG: tRNA preQ1(34) S-adenosylmethionine ribosyltransferase-isomerase QueA [Acidobacteria bacterium]|nr:tRNA preQ1(34) S-adenosylmethionine ribosyltransferase-isomerase QueA [Acidobacteriota bacterium]